MKIKGLKSIIGLLIGGAMSLSMMGVAAAAPINVGGVVWDPDSPLDFVSKAGLNESIVAGPGATLSGFGILTSINGIFNADSFCPGCEITFEFGGFLVETAIVNVVTDDIDFSFSGGWINFYVDSDRNFFELTPATAGDGTLWLTLVGHTDLQGGLLGTLFGSASTFDATSEGSGDGLLDVGANPITGLSGLANAFFNTKTRPDNLGGFADFFFTSEFQPAIGAFAAGFPLTGTATLQGKSIPEPASLAIFGFSLLGLGLVGRRRRRTA